jgi:hypothetical protein
MHAWFIRLSLSSVIAITTAIFILVSVTAPKAAQSDIDQFLASPSQVLTNNPTGGALLVSKIRALILESPTTLSAVIALLASANENQQSAIGAGLGQAALALVSTNPAYATEIQQALAASGVQVAITSFASVTGNVPTAATDAGGGGGGGGIGGPTGNSGLPTGGANGGSTGGGGTTSTATSQQNSFSSAGGSVSSSFGVSAGTNVSP